MKPILRVTKWLGAIPVEAECTACPDHPKFSSIDLNHNEHKEKLQRAFDRHLAEVHKPKDANEKAGRNTA